MSHNRRYRSHKRRYRTMRTRTSRLKNSFYPTAVVALNAASWIRVMSLCFYALCFNYFRSFSFLWSILFILFILFVLLSHWSVGTFNFVVLVTMTIKTSIYLSSSEVSHDGHSITPHSWQYLLCDIQSLQSTCRQPKSTTKSPKHVNVCSNNVVLYRRKTFRFNISNYELRWRTE